MSATLTPSPLMQFFDSTGAPLVSGTLSTYVAGTSTPLATYTDSTGLIANSVVITLNTRGEAAVWLDSTGIYKFVLKDAAGVLIWTADNIEGQVGLADLTNNTDATKGSALVGYLPAGASAVGTNVQTKLRQTMSVDDFGAVGNGSTNDYQAIINAQSALVAAGGGTLLFTQGKTYAVELWSTDGPVHFEIKKQGIDYCVYDGTDDGYSTTVGAQVETPAPTMRFPEFEMYSSTEPVAASTLYTLVDVSSPDS